MGALIMCRWEGGLIDYVQLIEGVDYVGLNG